ncbi:uncharacterized protein [Primulina eburnea]|uniref:uncharacterized protein n=1 Tax=Primulina eburnea TaxID=1245227 RepID=UPI003C6C85CD
MNSPEFVGGANPLVALEWVKSLEAIFDYLKFIDRDRVSCSVFMLVKAARIWWEATKVTVNVRELKCDEFVGLVSSLSIPLVSCLQATKLLNKGCTGFLALVSDVNRDSNVQLQNIDLVQDYPDVFVDDVPGLPPDREVEFVIELSPDASKQGLGDVLIQRGKVIAYASRQLKEYEKNYPTHYLELAAVNMRQRRWLELVKDYDCSISYHPGKANVVADSLSRVSEFGLNRDGLLTFRGRICVPKGDDIRKDILIEAHTAPYSVHPGSTKMYQDLRHLYWWPGLPRTPKGYNSIWVIVDSYQSSIDMAPYEALYGRKCRSPLYWEEVGERKMLGPELVQQTADVVALIQERMKTAQSRQKSYADVRRRPLAFEVGDHVFIKIAPLKGVMRFGKKVGDD